MLKKLFNWYYRRKVLKLKRGYHPLTLKKGPKVAVGDTILIRLLNNPIYMLSGNASVDEVFSSPIKQELKRCIEWEVVKVNNLGISLRNGNTKLVILLSWLTHSNLWESTSNELLWSEPHAYRLYHRPG